MVSLLTFSPIWEKKAASMLSHENIFNLPDTENTEREVRDLLGPPSVPKKKKTIKKGKKEKKIQDNIKPSWNKVISKISSTMLISAH